MKATALIATAVGVSDCERDILASTTRDHPGPSRPLSDILENGGLVSINGKALVEEGTPRYLASGDPNLADYYPAWLDNIADDATVEGSMLDGAVQGPDGVRPIVTAIRAFYGDTQEFHFTGPWGDSGWLEDYIARVDDKPLGCVVLVTRNTAGQTQHVVASYRPVSTVIHFSRLLHEKFAGTPYAKHFLGGE